MNKQTFIHFYYRIKWEEYNQTLMQKLVVLWFTVHLISRITKWIQFCVKKKLELFGEFLETENVACLKFTCLILDCYRHLALTAYC